MFVVEPKLAEQFIGRLVQQAEKMMKSNLLPVLLCSPELRRHIRAMSERVVPHLRVLSMSEIPQNIELKSWGIVAV
ncbi:FHIPEP family type III secretion protein [Ralstonia syzygii]|uniref:FHIPEP family type III secretion protein n=1 Tax=Ralstonia syzygii TaxID=28097 RepID=UPI0036F38295